VTGAVLRTARRIAILAAMAAVLMIVEVATSVADTHTLAPRSYKPSRNWCPTNRTCFTSIRWSSYGTGRAVGRGRAKECAGGGGACRVHPSVRATLTRPRTVCGARRFTRLRMFGNEFALDGFCQTYQG
jgi:hypothetical protein